MRVLALGLAVLAATPAEAATPVTYVFKGLVEFGDGAGTVPQHFALGTVGIIKITVDSSAKGSFTSNTATYVGGYACGNALPSPIISVTFSQQPGADFGGGACDQIVISQGVDGQSSITMQSASEEVGTTFSASFVTSAAGVVTSLAIPKRIKTTDFQRSFFMLEPVVSQSVVSGDMVSK